MGLARGWAVALTGVTGRVVTVEADIGAGLPGFGLIGLPDTALSEARVRVQAAVANSDEQWPKQKITVLLSPADLHKRGAGFDLVLALVVLAAADAVPAVPLAETVVLGELGLNGAVHGLRGVLPAVAAASRRGLRRAIVPIANLAEANLVENVEVIGVASLREALAVLRGDVDAGTRPDPGSMARVASAAGAAPDLRDVRGQLEARWALEVAAAGGHHLFMHGTPGTGKTMLAERLPGLLPPLSPAEALEVTEIHSVAGTLPVDVPLIDAPPFRAPHHSATQAAIVGGGSGEPRPGACSLAHRGILFLDEATEFRGGVLDALREPLESGSVVIARAGVTACFPARFLLVLAANPCACGRTGSVRAASCTCTSVTRRRYLGRLSRPLLDRMDLQVTVDRPSSVQLLDGPEGESTAVVAQRVLAARDRAASRLLGTPWSCNAQVPTRLLRTGMRIDFAATRVVEGALERGTLSARGLDRVFRIAWTLSDLAGRDRPGVDEVGGALALRVGAGCGWAA